MEESAGALLNVDVTEFIGPDMETELKDLEEQRQRNDHILLKMLEEGLNFDIILRARGGSVKAHRCVLSAVSPVFKAMFEHDMKEKLSSTVHIPDMTIDGLKLFLLVLYTIDEYDNNSEARLPWLFVAGIAKHFDEFFRALLKYQALRPRLESLVLDALDSNLTSANCWEYYDISLQFTEKSIPSAVRRYIVENFQNVLQSKEFLLEMKRNPDRVYSILPEAYGRQSEACWVKF